MEQYFVSFTLNLDEEIPLEEIKEIITRKITRAGGEIENIQAAKTENI